MTELEFKPRLLSSKALLHWISILVSFCCKMTHPETQWLKTMITLFSSYSIGHLVLVSSADLCWAPPRVCSQLASWVVASLTYWGHLFSPPMWPLVLQQPSLGSFTWWSLDSTCGKRREAPALKHVSSQSEQQSQTSQCGRTLLKGVDREEWIIPGHFYNLP